MKIGVISLKGGVGKTTISINLAALIKKELNKKVLLIDYNLNNNQTLLFVKNYYKIYGDRLWQGIIVTPFFHLKVVKNIEFDIKKDLEFLEKVYDYIIFDIPNEYNIINNMLKYFDKALLIINPDLFSIYSNLMFYKNLDKKDNIEIIVNKYDKSIDLDYIEQIFNKEIFGVIRYDNKIIEANYYSVPLPYYTKSSKSLDDLYEILEALVGYRKERGFIGIIKSIFS